MDRDKFNTDLFIDEVEKRVALWDVECSEYASRTIKRKCWQEIVDVFSQPGDTNYKRKCLVISLQKRWKGLRDTFVRELKRLKCANSDIGPLTKSSFAYFNRLLFLEHSIRNRNEDSAEQSSEDDLKHSRTKRNKRGPKRIKLLNELDSDKLFCLSLHKELRKVPEMDRLHTKIEMMNVILRGQCASGREAAPSVVPPKACYGKRGNVQRSPSPDSDSEAEKDIKLFQD